MSGKQVRDIMTTHPRTLGCNDSLSIADEVMKLGRVRHMPVVDERGRLEGILSQRDLLFNALHRALGFGTATKDKTLARLKVKECMTASPITISPDAPISEAARIMTSRKIGCLPVVEGTELVGILTESDFVLSCLED